MKWIIFTGLMASVLAGLGLCGQTRFNDEFGFSPKEQVRLVKNRDNYRVLPSNFRLSTSAYNRHFGHTPPRKGLSHLHASGSSQFSKRGFQAILRAIPSEKILLVDLREETHGFLDGTAVSLYGYHNVDNEGKTPEAIEKSEVAFLAEAEKKGSVLLYDDKNAKKPQPFHVHKSFSEKELAQKYNVPYVRLYVTDHHRPTNETVDRFVELVKNLHEGTWVHFHCAGGKGRTTTFLSMYDMIHNAKDVSFDDILRRQWLLGGIDLATPTQNPAWKYEPALKRKNFLKDFYQFVRENPELDVSWSEWLRSRDPVLHETHKVLG